MRGCIRPVDSLRSGLKLLTSQDFSLSFGNNFAIREVIMSRAKHALWALLLVAACGGNPFLPEDDGTDSGTDGGTDSGGIGGDDTLADRELPPGTGDPSRRRSIKRFEPRGEPGSAGGGEDDGGAYEGNGFVTEVSYNRAEDTFAVDNLGFDGDRAYTRGNPVANLGPYRVYEGADIARDPVSGRPVEQFVHRALYGVSRTGRTKFAIVRTGSYAPYGFGGFIYQRDGGVVLPTSGQANYTGKYAGLRDFNGSGGIGYTKADMTLDIDFDDFNDGYAVKGQLTNRSVFDLDGNDITDEIVTALSETTEVRQTELPIVRFAVGPNTLDTNGEAIGEVTSLINTADGVQAYETGQYYAIVAGPNSSEVVGIVVTEAEDPRSEGVTVRETGGFILYRGVDEE